MSKKEKKLSQKELRKLNVEKFSRAVLDASQTYGVTPSLVTKTQYGEFSDVSEWDLRKLGGFGNLLKIIFPADEADVIALHDSQRLNKYVSKLQREVGDKKSFENQVLDAIDKAITSLDHKPIKIPKYKASKEKRNMTMELMVSDVHYGKKSDTFNLEICRKRMKELTNVFLAELDQKEKSFNVEKIVIALLGDLMESFSMHGLESAVGCEFGNSRQVQEAIESLFEDVILPIAMTGREIIIPSVTGNHDRTETNRTMNNPGENQMTWIIYNVLEKYCKYNKLSNVKFVIPKDSYCVLDIYGSLVLYEHGDNLQNSAKTTIDNLIRDRSRQIGQQIHMARFGHWHEYVCFDRGRAIVNESVCGQDSYARVKGFASSAGQTINFYVDTKHRPTSFYYSFAVYLG